MKILHTKSTAEPILLATACHNMNLLAIVTRSLVVVYRSTTLTVVMTFPLSMRENETIVSACWSPSGRLFAIGVQSGELYLLDVESGDLVRRFAPRSHTARTMRPLDDGSAGNGDGETGDNDNEVDPLQRSPILPISAHGAIVACTWTSVALRSPAMHSHRELCLPLRSTVSSPIFEELEREDETPLLLILDQRGTLCFLPGGMQEVCVVTVTLPWALDDPHRMRVETFLVAAESFLETNDGSGSRKWGDDHGTGNLADAGGGGGGGVSYDAYLVVQDTSAGGLPHATSHVVRIHLSDTILAATDREVVTICRIAEYCRIGRVSYECARQRWKNLISSVYEDLMLPRKAILVRNALVEDIAMPCKVELLDYFKKLDLIALVKDAEALSQEFFQIVLHVSNVAYRCYDLALHLSQAQSNNRQRQCLLMDIIGGLRQRCSDLLHYIRLEAERTRELVQWVAQQASLRRRSLPSGAELFAAQPPLRAVRHPSLLRTLHRIASGAPTASPPTSGGNTGEEELARVVRNSLLAGGEAVARGLQLAGDTDAALVLQRQCEVLVADAAAGREGVRVHAVTIAKERPAQPLMTLCTVAPWGDVEGVLLAEQESIPVEMEPLQFNGTGATFLSCGVVDDEGSCVVLWERASGSDVALVLALVKADGAIEMLVDDENEDGHNDNNSRDAADTKEPKYALLEIKGISTRHLRTSLSRARGFGVFYARERFFVVDFCSC